MTLLGTAFAIGLIIGGAGIAMAARSGKATWIWRGRRPAGYGPSLERKLHLGLTIGERDSITAVWCRQQVAMDSIRQSLRQPMDSLFQLIRPAVDARRVQTRTEIRALLTAPQQQRYDSMVSADDAQRKKIHDQGPPVGSGPCASIQGGPGSRGGFNRD